MTLTNYINNNNIKDVKEQETILENIKQILKDGYASDLDWSLATATAADVVKGKTFLKDGLIETGTHECPEGFWTEEQLAGYIDRSVTYLPLEGLTSIKDFTFYYCTNLALTELPSSLTSIGYSAFENCTNLALTELPSSLTSIESYAFCDCTNLKTMKIKCQQLNSSRIFQNCSNLTKVWISSNCTTIDASSRLLSHFADCPDTLEIYTNATEKLSGWEDYFNRTGSQGSVEAVVHYNVSEAEFDAIIAEGGEA